MAAPAPRLLQDQNLKILDNGITPGGKTYTTKAEKKVGGGLGGRKALNDISNSRKPSVRHSVRKDNSINVFSTEKDTFAVKPKSTKAPERGKVGGRKALTDLTNSTSEQLPNLRRKANDVMEESSIPSCVAEERFIHNHQECIAAQTKAVDRDYFLKSAGLHHDIPLHPSARRAFLLTPMKQPESSNSKHLEMEDDVSELEHLLKGPNHPPPCPKPEVLGCFSPACRSPQSPKAPYMSWEDDIFSDLKIIDTPKVASLSFLLL